MTVSTDQPRGRPRGTGLIAAHPPFPALTTSPGPRLQDALQLPVQIHKPDIMHPADRYQVD